MTTDGYVSRGLGSGRLWRNRKPPIGRLDFEITERCNNDCVHCCINRAADDPEARRRELATDDIRRILKEAADMGALTVRFTGGEPLLREDFVDIYMTARQLGLKVVVFTNGTCLTPQLADRFKKTPPMEPLEISVYGMSAATCDAVTRTPGSFEAARRGIRLLKERGIPFVVKGVVLPPTRDEVERFEAWASSECGMKERPLLVLLLDLRSRRDAPKRNDLIRSLRLPPAEAAALMGRDRQGYQEEMRSFARRFLGIQGDKLFRCGAGGDVCADAYGSLQMCLMLRHPDTTYDLKTGSLRDALTRFFPRIREMRARNPAYLRRCARCFLKSLCEQCPAKSWTEHGTLDTPVEYLCDVTHAQAHNLGLLAEDERSWEITTWRERLARFGGTT